MGKRPGCRVAAAGRVVVGITMIAHGTNHWKGGRGIEGTARWFRGLGLRYGKLQAWMSVVTEIEREACWSSACSRRWPARRSFP